MRNIWIVNDLLTCIPGTKTFWHLLLEIEGAVDKTGIPFNKLAEAIEEDPGQCDIIIRNGTFFRPIDRDCKQVVLIQDLYGYDKMQYDTAMQSDYIVFNSEYTDKQFMKNVEMSMFQVLNTTVIPIGVNENLFKPTEKFSQDIFNRPKRGIFVGDYNTTKNTALFEQIVKKRSDVNFTYVSKAGSRINSPNVTNYTGGVNEQGMVKLYNQTDFCIMCSPHETLHLTTVEAALCDIPVIGTNTGWFSDYFRPEMGIVVDGELTVDKFSYAIDRVITGNYQPRKWMLETPFTWRKCKESWEKLIKDVIND